MARHRRHRRRNAPLSAREIRALKAVLFKHGVNPRRRKARKHHRRNPARRRARRIAIGVSPAGARLAKWRWHRNPRTGRRYLVLRRRRSSRRNPRVMIRGRRGRQVASFMAGTKNRAKLRRKMGPTKFARLVARGKRLAAKHGFQKYTAARLAKMRARAKRGWLIWRRKQLAKRR